MDETLNRLFHYKAWATDELLTALAALGEDSQVTQLAIKALSHTLAVDRIFLAHLQGTKHGFASANMMNLPCFIDLSASIRASDQEYVDYVWSLQPERLQEVVDFTFTDGRPGRMSREEILLHVITHGVGHRGQVSAVMLLNSIAPAKDGFTTYLHEAEANIRRRAA
jgi:uncharacterized damage-inducible protein DinB